jgi:3-dehydroquinate synthase
MRTLNVELGVRRYPIHIGAQLLGEASPLTEAVRGSQVMIVSNETVAPLYAERLRNALGDLDVATVTLPDGERYKNLGTLDDVYDALLARGFDRDCTIIALGGGVVGDMAGFAAATYQRGVGYIQVPTTLLALVDSAVGGKTGVNHARGKNMIGAFHQPRCVIADPTVLETLPDRELRAGIAEIIKYGLIDDSPLFEWLEQRMPDLLNRDPDTLAQVIEASCRNKARTVAADERESGQRALLNLGHTFAHAIETATGYSSWLHGEAVAAGLCMAARTSQHQGWLREEDFQRVRDLVSAAGLPSEPPAIPPDRFRELMAVDKKARAGRLRLVLLKGVGHAVVTEAFDDSALARTLDEYQQG